MNNLHNLSFDKTAGDKYLSLWAHTFQGSLVKQTISFFHCHRSSTQFLVRWQEEQVVQHWTIKQKCVFQLQSPLWGLRLSFEAGSSGSFTDLDVAPCVYVVHKALYVTSPRASKQRLWNCSCKIVKATVLKLLTNFCVFISLFSLAINYAYNLSHTTNMNFKNS